MLRIITIKELAEFAGSINLTDPAIPVSPIRALSQSKNPVASPDDPALVVAYNEANELLAYYGCLPEKLSSAPDLKVCWSSCWWGHPEKGKGATMKVFYQALKLWKGNMLFDALPPRSEAILQKMGFFSFRKIDGMRCFLRFKFKKILTSRYPALDSMSLLFAAADSVLNLLYSFRRIGWGTLPNNVEIKTLEKLDTETATLIQQHNQTELVGRSAESLNWIIENPWLEETADGKGPLKSSYYFSTYAKRFENHLIKVREEGKTVAVLFMTLRDGELKLPYAYFEKNKTDLIKKVIVKKMLELSAETFVCFHPYLLTHFKNNRAPFYHLRLIDKTFGYSTALEKYVGEDAVIQDGDGDVVFT